MAFKLSDTEYAQLATHATVANVSMGEVLRRLIRQLPMVAPEVVIRWASFRKRSGHERPMVSLEEAERQLAIMRARDGESQSPEQIHMEVRREEMLKDAQAQVRSQMRSEMSFTEMLERPNMIQLAELQELAEAGDTAAKEKLKRFEELRKKTKVEL